MSDYIYILGFQNCANYEAGAALIRVPKSGGKIDYVCIGEDRLTRIKNTYLFPLRGIDYCLKHFGLNDITEVDYIATDYARIPRWHNSGPAYRKLEHDYLKLMLRFPRERILIINHHDAHAASCYYPSQFKESGVLIVDGMGSELNTQSAYHFKDGRITWQERGYDWGIGRLYSLVTGSVLPYGPEKGFGKVMGLAPYGADQKGKVLDFKVANEGMTSDYSGFFSRFPISRIVAKNVPLCDDRQKVTEYPYARAAFEVQQECEEQLLHFANYIHKKTGTERLCIAGGVALNGRANYRIIRETPIKEVWIQPAASDTGISFGLALWAYYHIIQPKEGFPKAAVTMPNAYCGSSYSPEDVAGVLQKYGIESSPTTNEEVAGWIADEKIVAVFEGASEVGPRALGHRSILADPRSPTMKDKLNRSVKFREPYRPYAPVVLREFVSEYFDLTHESPFMLLVADVKKDKQGLLPAVTHIDGTARVQTVTKDANGNFYDLLKAFHKITGVPVFLNTSFNINREPIVETPLDALFCALSTSIDYLVMEGKKIDCGIYRQPELVQKIEADRKALMEEQYQALTKKYLYEYDPAKMKVYLEEENRIAEWHRDYRAKYELEQAMARWQTENKKILIVGTRAHTKCLFLYIPEFSALSVVGFVPRDDEMGEKEDFSGIYTELSLNNVPWDTVDEVLISTHEYQRKLEKIVSAAAPAGKKINCIYDTSADSLIYTLPNKWPVIHTSETKKYNLKESASVGERTASNVDFDFAPTPIAIGERYGLAVTYDAMRPDLSHGLHQSESAETPERFTKQLSLLAENFSFCNSRDLVDSALTLPESNILITFNHGLKDVADFAAPVLKRFNIPATVFISAEPYTDKRLLAIHKIEFLKSHWGLENFRTAFYAELAKQHPEEVTRQSLDYAGSHQFYIHDTEETRRFLLDLNYCIPYDKLLPVVDALFSGVCDREKEQEMVKETYLSIDDLKRLNDSGLEIGIHGYDYKILPRLDYKEQKKNIEMAMEFLESVVGTPGVSVAYPEGFSDNTTKRVLKELGVRMGLSMGGRIITPEDIRSRWQIPRYTVGECFHKADNSINYEVFASLSVSE